MAAMKTFTTTLSGLSSSLFLTVGLSTLAQKLDPVSRDRCEQCRDAHAASITVICSFPSKQRG
jgi:hypothetical protein